MLTGGEQEEMDAKRYLEEVPFILYKQEKKLTTPPPPKKKKIL
jgi:hypothetical protein